MSLGMVPLFDSSIPFSLSLADDSCLIKIASTNIEPEGSVLGRCTINDVFGLLMWQVGLEALKP